MADVGIYTKSADILVRAGANCNSTAITVAETDKYVLVIEALINAITGYDWSSAWTAGTLTSNVKEILTQASASKCAMLVIGYDPSGMDLAEAQFRIDRLNSDYKEALDQLDKAKTKSFVGEP